MLVTFLGGPLDGELREVPDESIRDSTATWLGEIQAVPVQDRMDYVHRDNHYHISNGIARHESVSEEEVARRVAAWRTAAEQWAEQSTRDLMNRNRVPLSKLT